MAPFVISANFESILEQLGRQAKQTTYSQHYKVCAAVAIFCTTLGRYNQLTLTKIGENAVTKFFTYPSSGRLRSWRNSGQIERWRSWVFKSKRIIRTRPSAIFAASRSRTIQRGQSSVTTTTSRDSSSTPLVANATWSARSVCVSQFFYNFRGYDAHLMVYKIGRKRDREIKVIGQNRRSISRWSEERTWSSATRFNSYLLLWSNSQPRLLRPAVKTLTISTRWSCKFIQGRTLNSSNETASSATTTSTFRTAQWTRFTITSCLLQQAWKRGVLGG